MNKIAVSNFICLNQFVKKKLKLKQVICMNRETQEQLSEREEECHTSKFLNCLTVRHSTNSDRIYNCVMIYENKEMK